MILKDNEEINEFNKEVQILQQFNNPNIIKLIHSKIERKYMFQFFELCNGGDVDQLLKLRLRIPEKEALIILKQIINGLKEFESLNVVHRDIKLPNLFLHFPKTDFSKMSKEEK